MRCGLIDHGEGRRYAGWNLGPRVASATYADPIAAVNPLVARVRALPGSYYRTAEVADALETSPAALRRLAVAHPDLAPGNGTYFGHIRVDLHDDDAVARLHARSPGCAPGHPRSSTAGE